jgi:CheY-like chemotaxis protein
MARLVYLADDEPGLLAVEREALEAAGYAVAAFPDGAKLLDAVRQRPPDLIFLDLNMPVMTGWEARERLLADPKTARIPVVAVTARGGRSAEQTAMRALGFVSVLRKPFRVADLLALAEVSLAVGAAKARG